MYVIPGGFYGYPWAFTRHPKEVVPMIRDFGGGSPCQGWVYCDDGLPETYRGRIFHCEWGKGKVLAVKVAPEGAGFKFVDEIAFMDPSGTGVKDFRPYMLRPTADGRGFYVTDWGFSGWSKAVKAGRIWKVTYEKDDVKPAPRGKVGNTHEELVKGLNHPAHSERLRIQRVLEEKWRKAAEERTLPNFAWVPNNWWKLCTTPATKRHILWAWYNGTGMPSIWIPVYEDPEPSVRSQVARIHGDSKPDNAGFLDRDRDPQVLLHMFAAFTRVKGQIWFRPDSRFFEETDPYVRHAIVQMLRSQKTWTIHDWQLGDKLKPSPFQMILEAHAEVFELDAIKSLVKGMNELKTLDRRVSVVQMLARNAHDRKPYAGGWWGTRPEKQQPPARTVAWEGTPLVRDALLLASVIQPLRSEKRRWTVCLLSTSGIVADPHQTVPARKERRSTNRFGAGDRQPQGGWFRGLPGQRAAGREEPAGIATGDHRGAGQGQYPAVTGPIAKVVASSESVAVQIAGLKALALSKDKKLASVCQAAIKSSLPLVKQATAAALGH